MIQSDNGSAHVFGLCTGTSLQLGPAALAQEWNAVAIPAAEHQAAGPRECSVGLDLNLTLRASDADSHRSKWETLLKAALVRAAGLNMDEGTY